MGKIKFLIIALWLINNAVSSSFFVGLSRKDITGPVAGWHLMGYVKAEQIGSGLMNRLFCRVFAISEDSKISKPIIIVHTDLQSISLRLRQEIVTELEVKYPNQVVAERILLHAQHTHSGPGGLHASTMYSTAAFGFSQAHLSFVKSQIVNAVEEALKEDHTFEADIYLSRNKLAATGRNRSPESFYNNNAADVKEFIDEMGETKNSKMTVLRIADKQNVTRAVMSFFPVHTTSIPNVNILINSDNKGFAEYVIEKRYSETGLIAAFFQTEAGDVSPNMQDGPDPLLFYGEGRNFIESCEAIGLRQAKLVDDVLSKKFKEDILQPSLKSSLMYHDFTKNNCKPMVGASMPSGTEDGRGIRTIREGITANNYKKTFRDRISVFGASYFTPLVFLAGSEWVSRVDDDSVLSFASHLRGHQTLPLFSECQLPKIGYAWTSEKFSLVPEILPLQILRFGNFVLPSVPFEPTSMAGFYIRKAIQEQLGADTVVEVLGYSNAYASYLATAKEYDLQHYEGSSTVFGRNQLQDTINQLKTLMTSLEIQNKSFELELDIFKEEESIKSATFTRKPLIEPHPAISSQRVFSILFPLWSPGVLYEDISESSIDDLSTLSKPLSINFGCVNPADSQRIVSSFCTVEKKDKSGKYSIYLTDHDWSLRFIYRKKYIFYDSCTCEWSLQSTRQLMSIEKGTYRIKFNGAYLKDAIIQYFSGYSKPVKMTKTFEKPNFPEPDFPFSVSQYQFKIPDEILLVISIIIYLAIRGLVTIFRPKLKIF